MAQQFVETIKIEDGNVQNIAYHQERMEKTIRHFFPSLCLAPVPMLDRIVIPQGYMDLYKARVVYGESGIETVEYSPYTIREINSLQVVLDDTIEYNFKSTNRERLNILSSKKNNSDDIIIVKHELVTDTSFTNIAVYDGRRWITPKHPLLAGTKRANLLELGVIQEADITLADLQDAQKVGLFNAMIEFGKREIAIKNIHF